MPQSKGEYRVGIDFNPSGDETVQEIKRLSADLIDLIEGIPIPEGDGMHMAEVIRLKSLAQTHIEDAAMWGVKAATKRRWE